jgi:hypothetical protein
MRVRLTQLDGKLPNIALMRIAAHHKARGDEVRFTKVIEPELKDGEEPYGRVYGSAIFNFSADRVERFRQQWPGAIVGGTWNLADRTTVEEALPDIGTALDYSIYPEFDGSIGFTQRGCRLKCGFCVVPKKEGKNHSVSTVSEIWRGAPWPKHLHLLDNDFFGQPREQWQARLAEITAGGFKVCLNQGINVRMIDAESAAALKAMGYWDDSFKYRRLYTAWDNVGDEGRFFTGIDCLRTAGIPSTHVMAYMLIGYDKRENWERVLYRFGRMVERGIRVYPMVFGDRKRTLPLGGAHPGIAGKTLAEFQRYAIRRLNSVCQFQDYDGRIISSKPRPALERQEVLL